MVLFQVKKGYVIIVQRISVKDASVCDLKLGSYRSLQEEKSSDPSCEQFASKWCILNLIQVEKTCCRLL